MATSTLTGNSKPNPKAPNAEADKAAKVAKAAQAEAKKKADAQAKAKKAEETKAKAKAEAEAKAKKEARKDTVADGRSLITKRGILGPGQPVTASDLKGGAAAFSRLKSKGFIL